MVVLAMCWLWKAFEGENYKSLDARLYKHILSLSKSSRY